MKAPNNTYTIRVGSPKTEPYRTVIRSANLNAFSVALEHFADVSPGEHFADQTYRFMSTTWGWIWVSVRPTEKDDYANPQIS